MNNRSVCFVTFILVIILLGGGTFYKVGKTHSDLSFEVINKRVSEGALQCVWDDKCENGKISFGELIEKGYAKEEVDPFTKMYYSHDSVVFCENNACVFEGIA